MWELWERFFAFINNSFIPLLFNLTEFDISNVKIRAISEIKVPIDQIYRWYMFYSNNWQKFAKVPSTRNHRQPKMRTGTHVIHYWWCLRNFPEDRLPENIYTIDYETIIICSSSLSGLWSRMRICWNPFAHMFVDYSVDRLAFLTE